MSITHDSNGEFEPHAQGRKAFWDGRAIWTNPLAGVEARAWTAGWKSALGELSAKRGGRVLSVAAAETAAWHTLLALYRPEDVSPRARRGASPRRSTARTSPRSAPRA